MDRVPWCKDITSAISQCGIVQSAANVGVTAPRKDRNNRTVGAGNLETPPPGPMKVYGSDDFSDPPGSRKTSRRQTLVNVYRSRERARTHTKIDRRNVGYESNVRHLNLLRLSTHHDRGPDNFEKSSIALICC